MPSRIAFRFILNTQILFKFFITSVKHYKKCKYVLRTYMFIHIVKIKTENIHGHKIFQAQDSTCFSRGRNNRLLDRILVFCKMCMYIIF